MYAVLLEYFTGIHSTQSSCRLCDIGISVMIRDLQIRKLGQGLLTGPGSQTKEMVEPLVGFWAA